MSNPHEPLGADAPQAILMAAGKGTRMGGDRPKVLYEVAGRPMLHWVIDACVAAGCARVVVVVGYQADAVREATASHPHADRVVYVEQTEQLGTGHAVQMAAALFEGVSCDVFVLAGDGPLIRAHTLEELLDAHRIQFAAATLATSVIDDPTGYGRVLRDDVGAFHAIVEQKDATPQQLAVQEVNPSYYCFQSDGLFDALSRVSNDNAQGEYYITDVPGLLKAEGQTVAVVDAVPPEDILSINNPDQLAEVDAMLRARLTQLEA